MYEKISKKKAEEWCRSQPANERIPYFETSAKDSIEVDSAFHAAARLAISKIPEDTPCVLSCFAYSLTFDCVASFMINQLSETIHQKTVAGAVGRQ